MGINVDRIIARTFLIGSALAGAGGVLYGLRYGEVEFFMGYLVGIKAFTAAVLGGIGNVPGAMVGGIMLGVIEGLGAGWLSSEWKDVIAFTVLVLVLLVKPSGLLGERIPERA
jgi:branched-chain amino acid transport system permease protein